jgi:hypothetical protein
VAVLNTADLAYLGVPAASAQFVEICHRTAEDRAVAENRSEAVDYPPLQTRSSLDAYDTFSRAATTQALNVVIDA